MEEKGGVGTKLAQTPPSPTSGMWVDVVIGQICLIVEQI